MVSQLQLKLNGVYIPRFRNLDASTKKENLTIDEMKISVDDLLKLNNKWFHNYNSN